MDGGLERLLDILRDSTLPRPQPPTPPDIWGFNGPPSARDISLEKQIALRHSLAFQCVVNIGVRGTEEIRTRVVQAGTLDLVAQMLESWLIAHGVHIHASTLGSEAAVQAAAAYAERRRLRHAQQGHTHGYGHQPSPRRQRQTHGDELAELVRTLPPGEGLPPIQQQHRLFGYAAAQAEAVGSADMQAFVDAQNAGRAQRHQLQQQQHQQPRQQSQDPTRRMLDTRPLRPRVAAPPDSGLELQPETERRRRSTVTQSRFVQQDTLMQIDVDDTVVIDDDGETRDQQATPMVVANERSMQVDDVPQTSDFASVAGPSSALFRDRGDVGVGSSTGHFAQQQTPNFNSSITPRARQEPLPMSIPIPVDPSVFHELTSDDTGSRLSSAGNSFSGTEEEPFGAGAGIPRTSSSASGSSTANESAMLDRELNETLMPGPSRRRAGPSVLDRIPQLVETDGPVSNQSSPMGTPTRNTNPESMRLRRETITSRPLIGIGMFTGARNAEGRRERLQTGGGGTSGGDEGEDEHPMERASEDLPEGSDELAPPVAIVEQDIEPQEIEEPDADALAAAQTAQDLFDGAPPGQPGTGVNDVLQAGTPRPPNLMNLVPGARPAPPVITATGAPRGFPDLASFMTSRLEEPGAEHEYSDSTVLVALQLLAYLSKYPHVRSVFYRPHRPMHPSFNYELDGTFPDLPTRPAASLTNNVFNLVERFRFQPNPNDPVMFPIPQEIQYWAGVIMRNACRKDEKRGGTRQCANMSCGRWEQVARQFSKCRRCRKAKYCSKECQSQGWAQGHRYW